MPVVLNHLVLWARGLARSPSVGQIRPSAGQIGLWGLDPSPSSLPTPRSGPGTQCYPKPALHARIGHQIQHTRPGVSMGLEIWQWESSATELLLLSFWTHEEPRRLNDTLPQAGFVLQPGGWAPLSYAMTEFNHQPWQHSLSFSYAVLGAFCSL